MKKLILITALSLSSLVSYSQNYNDALLLSKPGIYYGARSLSMGNSFTAISNNFSGVLFNPAGIGLIKNAELSGGMSFNSFNNNTTFFNEISNANKTSVNFSQFGLVYPVPTIQGSWVFALGYNRVKDFNRIMEFDGFNSGNNSMIQTLTGDYNEEIPITNDLGLAYEVTDPITNDYIRDETLINGFLNQSGTIKKQGSTDKWSFATSFEAAKGFFIGGTFNIISGSYKSESDFWEDDTKNNYGINMELVPGDQTTRDFQTFYLNDVIDWNLSGWDSQLGILYNWNDKFRFGASIKFPSYYTIKEDYLVDASSYFGTGFEYNLNPAIIDPIQYEIKTPFEYSLGASLNFSVVTVAGDLKIMDYTQMGFTEGFDYEYRNARQKEIDDLFTSTIDYHLGAEVKLPNLPIFGRAGVMYLQSPYDNDPSEFDKKYFTLGAGILIDSIFGIDVAYAYGWWKDFGDNYSTNVSRTYQDINVNNLILNLSARF
ncbi:MAG: outer membrane protein transport protein [Ignavibacteriaceae bacterium]|nr:outer membrane protein transport protein [Ignavibacteriaceae bacterium]